MSPIKIRRVIRSTVTSMAFCATVLLSACNSTNDSSLNNLQVNSLQLVDFKTSKRLIFNEVKFNRINWDEYEADYQLVNPKNNTITQPDAIMITAYNGSGKEILHTNSLHFTIKDHQLGSEEKIIIRMCAIVGKEKTCSEKVIQASKKTLAFDAEITYPLKKSLFLGFYLIECQTYRSQFGDKNQTEKAASADGIEYFLSAASDQSEESQISIPLSGKSGTFNLTEAKNYEHFKNAVEHEISKHAGSMMDFEITAKFGNETIPVQQSQKMVGKYKSKSDNSSLHVYAASAAKKIMKLVEPKSGYNSSAGIQHWSYQEEDGIYAIQFNAQWQSEWYIEETMKVNGTLYINPDGSNARFRFKYANDPVRDLEAWQGKRLNQTIRLGNFAG